MMRTIANSRLVDGAKLDNIVEVNPTGTNDHISINAKIDELSAAGGGIIYLPAGNYVGEIIILKDNVYLEGDGDSTVYAFDNTDFDSINDFGFKINGSNCGVRKMCIDGTTRAAGAFGRVRGIDIIAESDGDIRENITIQDLTINKTIRGVVINIATNANTEANNILVSNIRCNNVNHFGSISVFSTSTAVNTQSSKNIIYENIQYIWKNEANDEIDELFDFNKCENCTLKDSYFICDNTLQIGQEAIDMVGYHRNCYVSNVTIIGNFNRHIRLMNSSSENRIVNNYFEYIPGATGSTAGIIISNDDSDLDIYPENNIIANNIIKGGDLGILLEGVKNNVISGNQLLSNERGIKIVKESTAICSNNQIINNYILNTQTSYGILIDNDCEYNLIDGNYIIDNQLVATMTNGIQESSTADNNTIINNTIVGETLEKLVISGVNTSYKNNNDIFDATATTDGASTGQIHVGNIWVNVTSDNADKIIKLPIAKKGAIIWLQNGSTGYEMRTRSPSTISINGGTGTNAESAIAANMLVRMVCTSTTTWIGTQFATDGTESKVEAAAP